MTYGSALTDLATVCWVDTQSPGNAVNANRTAEIIDSVLEFRAVVRAEAIQGIKATKTPNGSMEGELQRYRRVLERCDRARERLSELFDIQIDDIGDTSRWEPRGK